MAVNKKRVSTKWVRDKAKSAYEKLPYCFICGTQEELELHHTHSMSLMLTAWTKKKGITLDTDEDVLEIRDEFIAEHHKEIYEDVFTLCNPHHVRLHSIFGKAPALTTSEKQTRWVNLQKEKHENKSATSTELVPKGQSSTTFHSDGGGQFCRLLPKPDYFSGF